MPTLPRRVLAIVTDVERAGGEASLLRIVDEAVRGGVNFVEVRAHGLNDTELTALARKLVATVSSRAIVVVNGPTSVALEAGASGVHLPESARLNLSPLQGSLLVGRSVHSLESARKAAAEGVDYIILGTVFPSASHPGGVTVGTELVTEVTSAVDIPVIGIGGITAHNAADVVAAGAAGVAVIGAIIGADNPYAAANDLAQAVLSQEKA